MEKVTIYTTSEMFGSVQAHRGKLVEYGRKKYAQYDQAPFVIFIPKGKRNPCKIIKGYRPYLLIIKGHDTPDPEGMFDKTTSRTEQDGKVFIQNSKYSSFDDRYKIDFDQIINKANIEIVADYRA